MLFDMPETWQWHETLLCCVFCLCEKCVDVAELNIGLDVSGEEDKGYRIQLISLTIIKSPTKFSIQTGDTEIEWANVSVCYQRHPAAPEAN